MVLALLAERPMHPYEMQRLVLERGKNAVINIKRGSIYHAVERLEHAGFIEQRETSREGRRPERTVYQITAAGREEVRDWLLLMLAHPRDEFPEFLTAVSFMPVLEPREVLGALQHRLVVLDGAIARTEATLGSVGGRLPRVFLIEEEYQLTMQRAERDWVAAIAGDFQAGRLNWSWEEFAPYSEYPLEARPPAGDPGARDPGARDPRPRDPGARDPRPRDPVDGAVT
jgi:DNA-binding PadR family transcriptional regulator